MNQIFEEFLRECQYTRRLSPETIRSYAMVFTRLQSVLPELDRPGLITTAHIAEFFKRIEFTPAYRYRGSFKIKGSTLRTYWSKLFSFCEWLSVKRILPENPMRQMRPPLVEIPDSGELPRDSLQRIATALLLHPGSSLALKRDIAMFYTLVFCGVRRNELLMLQVGDIDLEKQIVTIRAMTSKSRKSRILPLHTTLRYHLKEYLEERRKRGFVCPALWINSVRDLPLTNDGLKHWITRLKRISKINLHLHQFRHTFACSLARQNVNAVKIQKLLGHADVRMTMTYLRSLSTEDLREDVERLSLL